MSWFEYDGPFPGKRHSFMLKGNCRVQIPNPHRSDISVGLLNIILRTAGITEEEWESSK
ncbi:MAG: hypothetical protein V2A61_04465 [Calditrichota bacterium]